MGARAVSEAALAPRLLTLYEAKRYLRGLAPGALGVKRIPHVRRLLFDRAAIDAALDWINRAVHGGLDWAVNQAQTGTANSPAPPAWEAGLDHAERSLTRLAT